jgi:hypothetical protein
MFPAHVPSYSRKDLRDENEKNIFSESGIVTQSNPPKWVQEELEAFRGYWDANRDGQLDESEVLEWLLPRGHEQQEATAMHLIAAVDMDEDGQVSKSEMNDRWWVFAHLVKKRCAKNKSKEGDILETWEPRERDHKERERKHTEEL